MKKTSKTLTLKKTTVAHLSAMNPKDLKHIKGGSKATATLDCTESATNIFC